MSFELQNSIGSPQLRLQRESGQDINLIGEIRLQDLDEAPDPSSYFLVLELKDVNSTDGNITVEWEEVANRSGVIGGDFDWNVDLLGRRQRDVPLRSSRLRRRRPVVPAGNLQPRRNLWYSPTSPSTPTNPTSTCRSSAPGTDSNVDSNWRTLLDDTWVVPQVNQQMDVGQDLPSPPASLDMHLLGRARPRC